MRLVPIAHCSLLIALLAGCGGDDDDGGPSASPGPSPTPGLVREAERELEGVRLRLRLDRETFGPGDDIRAVAEAENVSEESVTYVSSPGGEAAFRLTLAGDVFGDQELAAAEQFAGTLEPGDNLDLEALWDQLLTVPNSPIPAPAGRYSITARLLVRNPLISEPVEVAAAVTFRLEGGPDVTLPDGALRAAAADQTLVEWGKRVGGTVTCALAGALRFYNVDFNTGAVTEGEQETYDLRVQIGTPICGILTVPGDSSEVEWQLSFLAPQAEEPRRITAFVGVLSGELLRVSEGPP